MAIDTNKFVKLKRFDTQFDFDDVNDKVSLGMVMSSVPQGNPVGV